ncbi:MAG: hypothetical protein R3B90_20935 [Planctomycetaceae bacterium]
MLSNALRRTRNFLAPLATGTPIYLGLWAAALICLWWSQLLAACGASLPVIVGLMIAALGGFALGSRPASRGESGIGGWLLALSLWTALLPLFIKFALSTLGGLSVSSLSSRGSELLIGLGMGAVLLAFPHYCLARLGCCSIATHAPLATRLRPAASLWGLAAGLLMLPTWIAPEFGLFGIGMTALTVGVLWGMLDLWVGQTATASASSQPTGQSVTLTHGVGRAPVAIGFDFLLLLAGGGMIAIAGRVISQLWLQSLYVDFATAAGVTAGVGLGLARRRRVQQDESASQVLAAVCLTGTALALPALFTPMIDLTLRVTAGTASVDWLLAYRVGLCVLCALPSGLVIGGALARSSHFEAARGRGRVVGRAALLTGAGLLFVRWNIGDVRVAAVALAALSGAVALGAWLRTGFARPASRRGWIAAGATAVFVIVAGLSVSHFDPVRSARLLFSTQTFAAANTSADRELLLALDESRLTSVITGQQSVLTTWVSRANTVLVRADGVPFGSVCLDSYITPDAAAELMAGTIPLAVHPQADHVLVVGLGSGATVSSTTEFPIRSVTCVEGDRAVLQLAKSLSARQPGDPLSDARVSLVNVNPTLVSLAQFDRAYDVIVLNERQLVGSRAMGNITADAYSRWAGHLAAGGILCQRLEYVDYGARPVRDILRTLEAVFPQVVVWESSPGELLVLATLDSRPLVNDGLLARFNTPHVRRLMARIGWDWSLPLSLVAVKPEQLSSMLAGSAAPATISDPHLTYSLPVEVNRWAPKAEQLRSLLNPVATPVFTWLEASPELDDLKKRLADANEQRELINRYPDHFWAYRKVLRERLQERPRATIVPVKHEGIQRELHPEDVRRKEYLAALGAAATRKQPSLESLREVAGYFAPFDPLVTPFLDGEVARLYARNEHRDYDAELAHWLRSTYFRPGFDRSVGDTIEALEILTSNADLQMSATQRWDHVNSLLEILKVRWGVRRQVETVSQFDTADATKALAVAKAGIAYLSNTAADAGIDPEWAELRSRVLERTLVRALRNYQNQQSAQLLRQRQQAADRQQSNVPVKSSPLPTP